MLLPVHLLFHVGGVTAAIIGQQKTAITQPVDVYLDVGAIHNDDVCCWGLTSYLQDEKGLNSILKKKRKANYEKKRRYLKAVLNAFIYKVNIDRIEEAGSRKNLSSRKKQHRVLKTNLSERKKWIRQLTFPGNGGSQTCSF